MDIELKKYDSELLSPNDYLKLREESASNILQSSIVPPNLGDRDFGKIKVTYRSPIYKF